MACSGLLGGEGGVCVWGGGGGGGCPAQSTGKRGYRRDLPVTNFELKNMCLKCLCNFYFARRF